MGLKFLFKATEFAESIRECEGAWLSRATVKGLEIICALSELRDLGLHPREQRGQVRKLDDELLDHFQSSAFRHLEKFAQEHHEQPAIANSQGGREGRPQPRD